MIGLLENLRLLPVCNVDSEPENGSLSYLRRAVIT